MTQATTLRDAIVVARDVLVRARAGVVHATIAGFNGVGGRSGWHRSVVPTDSAMSASAGIATARPGYYGMDNTLIWLKIKLPPSLVCVRQWIC